MGDSSTKSIGERVRLSAGPAGAGIAIAAAMRIDTQYGQPFSEFLAGNGGALIWFAAGLALFFASCFGRRRGWAFASGRGSALAGGGRRAPRTRLPAVSVSIAAAVLFGVSVRDLIVEPVGLDGPALFLLSLALAIGGAALFEGRRRRAWLIDLGVAGFGRGRPWFKRDGPWLALFIGVWAAAQIPGLDTRPGFFHGDEATIVNYGRSAYRPLPVPLGRLGLPTRAVKESPWENVFHPILTCVPRAWAQGLFPDRPYLGSRLFGVGVGVVTVLLFFLTARAGLGRVAAWAATLIFAMSHITLRFSRSGFTNLDAVALMLLWALALRGAWRSRRLSMGLMAGVLSGLAYYLYFGALLMLPLTAALAATQLLRSPRSLVRRGLVLSAVALGFGIAAAPNFLYARFYSHDFAWHRNEVLLLGEARVEDARAEYDARSNGELLLKYSWPAVGGALLWEGDPITEDYASADEPFTDRPTAALLLLGLAGAAALWRRHLFLRFVALWWVLAIALGSLLTIWAPFPPRLVMSLPPACLLAGWTLASLARRVHIDGVKGRAVAALALAAAAGIGQHNLRHYYFEYSADRGNIGYQRSPMGMMDFLRTFPPDATMHYYAPWIVQLNTASLRMFDSGFPRYVYAEPNPPPPIREPSRRAAAQMAYVVKLPEFADVDRRLRERFGAATSRNIMHPYYADPTYRVYWVGRIP